MGKEFDFDSLGLPSLATATAGEELNKLAFDPDDYPSVDDVIQGVFSRLDRPAVEIDLLSLSNGGEILADPMHEYLAKKRNSSSALKEVKKTPLHYFFHREQTFPRKDKKCFELGTFAHLAFIEPELFDKVAVEPNEPRSSKDGVTKLIRFYENLNGISPLFFDDMKFQDMKDYLSDLEAACKFEIIQEEDKLTIDILKRHYYSYGGGIIPKLLKGARGECSFYGTDPSTGLPVKVRPDWFNVEENIGVNAVISLKTTRAETIGKFEYDSAKLDYQLSEGMYQEVCSQVTGRKFNVTIMIMLQTVPPFLPAVLFWDAEDLAIGKYAYRQALDTIQECEEKGLFPGFDAKAPEGNFGIIEFKQPSWNAKEYHPTAIDEYES